MRILAVLVVWKIFPNKHWKRRELITNNARIIPSTRYYYIFHEISLQTAGRLVEKLTNNAAQIVKDMFSLGGYGELIFRNAVL